MLQSGSGAGRAYESTVQAARNVGTLVRNLAGRSSEIVTGEGNLSAVVPKGLKIRHRMSVRVGVQKSEDERRPRQCEERPAVVQLGNSRAQSKGWVWQREAGGV